MATKELDRIRTEYARREREIPFDQYAPTHPHNLFAHQHRSRSILKALVAEGLTPLCGRWILDVGCGEGQQLLELIIWGADRAKLAGIDLLERRVAVARVRVGSRTEAISGADLRAGDASQMPWANDTFDLVFQNTMFTSILDPTVRRSVAAEIVRVLKPGGVLIWYDFFIDNPRNPHVRGVGAAEIRELFAGCLVRLERITLAPPIARRMVPISWIASSILEKMRVCNTHYLAVVRKR